MERYSITEVQLNTNGAIGQAGFDYGTNKTGAESHFHTALASGLASGLIAETVILTMMDDETGMGWTKTDYVKGTGTYIQPEEGGEEE